MKKELQAYINAGDYRELFERSTVAIAIMDTDFTDAARTHHIFNRNFHYEKK